MVEVKKFTRTSSKYAKGDPHVGAFRKEIVQKLERPSGRSKMGDPGPSTKGRTPTTCPQKLRTHRAGRPKLRCVRETLAAERRIYTPIPETRRASNHQEATCPGVWYDGSNPRVT